MHMDRSNQRRIWPADLVSAVSGTIAILSFFGASQLPSTFLWPLIAVAFGSTVVLYFAFAAGNDLRAHGSHVLPFGLGVLERTKDGANWLTEPVAACPLCPADKQSVMRVQRSIRGPVWVCGHTAQHEIGFDGAQLPQLIPGA
ncbi:hypothetical protein C5B85_08985 [Pseudoclavibacter sp. AY1F1]|nr:hypothetical protein C5B85_08985 [Pseudoclavibacter sp. AY1F1]